MGRSSHTIDASLVYVWVPRGNYTRLDQNVGEGLFWGKLLQQQAFFWCWWMHQLVSIVIAGSTITSEGNTTNPGPGRGSSMTIWGREALGEALEATLPPMQEPIAVSTASAARQGEGSLAMWLLASLQTGDRQLFIVAGRDFPFRVGIKTHMDMLVKQFGLGKGSHMDGMEHGVIRKRALSRSHTPWCQAGNLCPFLWWNWNHGSNSTPHQLICTCSNLGCKVYLEGPPPGWWPTFEELLKGTLRNCWSSGWEYLTWSGILWKCAEGWSSPNLHSSNGVKGQNPYHQGKFNLCWSSTMPLIVASMGVEQIPGTIGASLRQAMYGEARLANWEEPGLQKLLFRHLEKCSGLRGQAWSTPGRTFLIDTMILHDPAHGKSLRSHKGFHSATVRAVQRSMHFDRIKRRIQDVIRDLQQMSAEDRATCTILMVCKSGRHRSVCLTRAVGAMIVEYLEWPTEEAHLSDFRWKYLCANNCRHCHAPNDDPGSSLSGAHRQHLALHRHLGPCAATTRRGREGRGKAQGGPPEAVTSS